MLNVLSLKCFANHLLFIRSQKCICDEFINDQINTLKAANRDNDVTRSRSKICKRQTVQAPERAVRLTCVYCIRIVSCAQIDNARVNIEYTSSIKARHALSV